MKTTKDLTLFAPCGTYCGGCECYTAKDDAAMLEYLVAKGVKREKLPCPGCREVKGNCPVLRCTCETYECLTARHIDFCFECSEFPCPKLNPTADHADSLPHNIKIYNLCLLKEQGFDKLVERFPDIKKRYFKGKMYVGKGPQLE